MGYGLRKQNRTQREVAQTIVTALVPYQREGDEPSGISIARVDEASAEAPVRMLDDKGESNQVLALENKARYKSMSPGLPTSSNLKIEVTEEQPPEQKATKKKKKKDEGARRRGRGERRTTHHQYQLV